MGYGNEALTIYFLCGREGQKAANLTLDDRVSPAIDDDPDQVMVIKGVSMAARARRVVDPAEGAKASPAVLALPSAARRDAADPKAGGCGHLGFAHADPVQCDLQPVRG